MRKHALLACAVICVIGQSALAQTTVTIDMTSVDNGTVLGAGKITIDKDDVYVGTKIYLEDKDKNQHAGFLNTSPTPDAGKTVDWDGTWLLVPNGDYTMVIEVLYIRGFEQKTATKTTKISVK